jgi:aminoglycoside phosphotransferase (APT) family kinase protein
VPDALLHGDIHPGNIARNEHGYTFFDWTDAAVGQPFLDMIAIASEDDAHTANAMRAAYLAEWATVTGPEPAERAWQLAVVLMAANQAISSSTSALTAKRSWAAPERDADRPSAAGPGCCASAARSAGR